MQSVKDVKDYYDKAIYGKLQGFIYTNERVEYALQSLKTIFHYTNPKRVLEIGCGIGDISYRLACEHIDTFFTGFDISEKSIDVAKLVFKKPNLFFVRHDSVNEISYLNKQKFDIVFLMDVYEHISKEERPQLHNFIKENLAEKGFVFFSCPTPQHLSYLKVNHPNEIQPVDENISMKELLNFSNDTGIKLIYYREISVWRAGDYFHAIFSNYLNMQHLSDANYFFQEKSLGLKKEMRNKLKQKLKPGSNSLIDARKELIRNTLGKAELEKIETLNK